MTAVPALASHDPAVAIAMAHCLAARSLDGALAVTPRHERRCGWCEYPLDELRAAVAEFNRWAEFDDRARTSGHHAVRAFAALPRIEQERQVREAQGFEPESTPSLGLRPAAEALPAVEPPPPDVVEEEPIPWMR